ncbi:MAG: metallophosphoesterase [Clostridia bacterium]|jgi:predicted phosphohydrolase|nr:metallophosphoesterase [Clostridia bacterium]
MSLYAIADLHLSFKVNKPMDIFGDVWVDYENKIKKNWIDKITDEDLVLIPGDISWAMKTEDAIIDLDFIDSLPGKKLLIKGNHDYWWNSVNKLNDKYVNMTFMQNDFYVYEDYAICGSRGWLCPNEVKFDDNDDKLYKREVRRIEASITKAINAGYNKIIIIMHYPPTNDRKEESEFIKLFREYNVEKVIYGHLHTKQSFNSSLIGMHDGIEYILSSADYIDFNPINIL